MKKEKGITLVTLVVTIIVLIILAGVSLNATLGDNGIITQAQKAKENMELARVEEEEQLNSLYEELAKGGEGIFDDSMGDAIEKLENFKKIIATAITNEGVSTAETDTAETMAENISKILQERTKDATATADNITKGKTAWINGKLVTGTGKDNNTFYEQGKNETSSNEVVTTINCTVSDGPNYWSTVVWVDVSNFNTLELGTLTGGDAHNSSGVITVQADGRTILSETANGNKTLDVSKYEEVTIAIQGRYAKTMKLPIVLY